MWNLGELSGPADSLADGQAAQGCLKRSCPSLRCPVPGVGSHCPPTGRQNSPLGF